MFDREKNGGDGERGGVLIEMRPSNTMVLLGEILTFYTFSPLAFMGGGGTWAKIGYVGASGV